MVHINKSIYIAAPIRGCFPQNQTLPVLGPAPLLSSPVCEMQDVGMVSACMCTTAGCNGDNFIPRPRVEKIRQPKNFIFPFAKSSPVDQPLPRGGRQRRLKCFSCGSLFNTDRARCDQFDQESEEQVMTCEEGEACMLYTWQRSKTEIGESNISPYHLVKNYMESHRFIPRVFIYKNPPRPPRQSHRPHAQLLLVQDTAGEQVLHQGLPLHSGLLQQCGRW